VSVDVFGPERIISPLTRLHWFSDDKKKIIEFLQSLDPSDRRISAVSSILRCCDPSARVAIIEHVQNMDPHARIGIALDFIHQELADQPNTQQNVLHRQLSSQNHDGNESSYNNEIALDVGTAGEQQATDNDTTQQQPRSLPSEDAPRAAMTNVATSGEQQVAGDDTAPRQPERMPSEDSSTSSMTESASTE